MTADKLRSLASRTLLAALVWWALTEGETRGLPIAGVVIALTVAASLAVVPAGVLRLRPGAAVRFVPYFLGQSARGAIDVARRTLPPRPPVEPRIKHRRLRLDSEPARVLVAGCLSLFAGTFSARLDGRDLTVHILDDRLPVADTIDELEERVAAIFGLELDDGARELSEEGEPLGDPDVFF